MSEENFEGPWMKNAIKTPEPAKQWMLAHDWSKIESFDQACRILDGALEMGYAHGQEDILDQIFVTGPATARARGFYDSYWECIVEGNSKNIRRLGFVFQNI